MKALVFNCGSSSLKYRIISMPDETEIAGGEAQRIGPKTAEPSRIIHRTAEKSETHFAEMRSHSEALGEIGKILARDKSCIPDAFGHRVVHGGELFSSSALITVGNFGMLEKTKKLAPIHNPPAMEIIGECLRKYPDVPCVAVFDTAFHSTIPNYASTYCLPSKVSEKLQIKKYG
ncbi:MAG: acetate kinase, partial [Victivallales bacterium]